MKKQCSLRIIQNNEISPNVFDMIASFSEDLSGFKPGQFAQIFLDNSKYLLPRPISICEFDEKAKTLRFVYHIAGEGTKLISEKTPGENLRILAPLGNGFPIESEYKNVALIGGGIGVPPLVQLCKTLSENHDANISVFLGYRTSPFLDHEFTKYGAQVYLSTDDGSAGFKGNAVSLLESVNLNFDAAYACGPKVMLKNLAGYFKDKNAPLFVSMEERMACGIGVCVGCVLAVKSKESPGIIEHKKICLDGPVFDAKEVIWE